MPLLSLCHWAVVLQLGNHTYLLQNSKYTIYCKIGIALQKYNLLQNWTYLCFMLQRTLLHETIQTAKEFKAVCITGPRQSGKTTLAKLAFPKKVYVSLEDPDVAQQASENGRDFLNKYPNGAILDEIQRVPTLFNYLQKILDEKNKKGLFILSGSNNFLKQQSISQSLAGRVGYIELLPLSYAETKIEYSNRDLEDIILTGGYPLVVTNESSITRWMQNYVKTYLEKDVALLRNISNMSLFNKFLKLCAGRAGQLLNIQNFAMDVGVDHKTIQAWLHILQRSYIIFLVQPYFQNYNKRVIKSAKLYFIDTGILCHLLQITNKTSLVKSDFWGAIFENFIVSEMLKNRYNKIMYGDLYFFRDSAGNEVDIITIKDDQVMAIEIKANKKHTPDQIKGLQWWNKINRTENGLLIYGGNQNVKGKTSIEILSWKNVDDV